MNASLDDGNRMCALFSVCKVKPSGMVTDGGEDMARTGTQKLRRIQVRRGGLQRAQSAIVVLANFATNPSQGHNL
jgi:hypothetical protein